MRVELVLVYARAGCEGGSGVQNARSATTTTTGVLITRTCLFPVSATCVEEEEGKEEVGHAADSNCQACATRVADVVCRVFGVSAIQSTNTANGVRGLVGLTSFLLYMQFLLNTCLEGGTRLPATQSYLLMG